MLSKIIKSKYFLPAVIAVLSFGFGINNVSSQASPSTLYVPLIGITSVPSPLSLPSGPGDVLYKYAVKNFLLEVPLSDIKVVDDKCSPVKFSEGDDDKDGMLDYDETWRFTCSTRLTTTSDSIATATGTANDLNATHKAYTTVVVGANIVPPLVSIVNITKVSYPLSLPVGGGDITFTYKVNNPGEVPLSRVSVVDDKCSNMSNKLGDTNGNNLLDVGEVWVYTCKTRLTQTTTNTVSVSSYANGLRAVGYATLTVVVETLPGEPSPDFPNTGGGGATPNLKVAIWAILGGILLALIIFFYFARNKKVRKT